MPSFSRDRQVDGIHDHMTQTSRKNEAHAQKCVCFGKEWDTLTSGYLLLLEPVGIRTLHHIHDIYSFYLLRVEEDNKRFIWRGKKHEKCYLQKV